MANSRIDDLRMVDPVLTTVISSYSNNSFVADKIFPIVKVSKLKGKIPVFGREAFVVRDTDRAIGSKSNRIPPAGLNFVEFETREHDVEAAVDYIEEEETPAFIRYEQRLAKQLTDIIALGREKEAADYLQDTTNFDSSLLEEVAQADAFDDYTSNTDPISVISDCMSAVRTKIAKFPNTMIIGEAAFNSLAYHPKVLAKIQYSGLARTNLDIFSELTGIKDIHIGMSVYSTDGETFTDIWGDNIILAYVDKSPTGSRSEFNPSYGYTFRREGMPEIDTYYENGGKIKVIRSKDNYAVKTTASDAAFLIHNVNHS